MKKIHAVVVLSALITAMSVSADAVRAELMSTWNYTVDAKITHVTPSHDGWSETTGYGKNQKTRYSFIESTMNDSKLSWGVESVDYYGCWARESESTFQMTPLNGQYQMGTGPKDALKLTHTNSALTGIVGNDVPYPAFIDIALDFKVSNAADPGISGNANVKLNMGFWETPNSGDHYVGFPDDIFFFLNPFESYEQIQLGDSNFFLSLFTSFDKLEGIYYDAAAEKLGITDGTDIWGWVTPEYSVNDYYVGFEITETLPEPGSVPEPATMLIFGLAAVGGLPVVLRRRLCRNHKESV